ncbi:MAG: hypothetical protein EA401_03705 [Planctomycetota bacterium]|nr:MAG: hypothetical protein EA401_03705 [Planctomycetota bacterium]
MAAWWRSLFGPRFWVMAYGAMILGFVLPAGWLPETFLQGMVPLLLGGILFFSGLRFPLWEMCEAACSPRLYRQLLALLPVKLAVLPILAYLCVLPFLPAWAVGVYLVMLMPMGLSSIAFTDLYRGNRMLSIALVVGSSVLAPVSVPLLVMVIQPSDAERLPWLPLLAQAGYILTLLLLPLIASQFARGLFPRTVARYQLSWNAWAICCSCLLVLASISGTRSMWQGAAWESLLGAVIACSIATLVTMLAMVPLWRLMRREDAVAFALGSIFMNNGLAVAFALQFFPNQVTMILPAVLMQVPMVAGTAYIGWLAMRHHRLVSVDSGGKQIE